MNDPRDVSELRRWLESESSLTLLKSLSQVIVRKFAANRTPIPIRDIPAGSAPPFSEKVSIVLSEITAFLLENETRLSRVLTAVPEEQWDRILQTAFINHLKDRLRQKDGDPFKRLYRRATDVIRKNASFHSVAINNSYMTMALIPEAVPIGPVNDEDLADTSVPASIDRLIPTDGVWTEATLNQLARHFLEEMARLWNEPAVRVRVSDFTRWLYRFLPPEPCEVHFPPRSDAEEEAKNLIENTIPDPGSVGRENEWFDREKVAIWAGQAAARINVKEAQMVLYYYAEALTMDEVAKRTGKKGASAIHYHIDHFQMQLKSFLRDRPWLSPEDINSEAFFFFWEALIENLKKRFPTPLPETKETDIR